MLIVWKGGKSRIDLNGGKIAGTVLGTGGVMAVLAALFLVPYLYRRVIHEDWQLRPWHLLLGPLVLRRGEIPPRPADIKTVQDYYRGHRTLEEIKAERTARQDEESGNQTSNSEPKPEPQVVPTDSNSECDVVKISGPRPAGSTYSPAVLFWQFKRFFFRGIEQDVVSMQSKRNILAGDLEMTHAHADHFENDAEHMFSFLQVLTACTASFAHGANDLSKYALR